MKPKKKIYLDHNATTPVDPKVLDTMIPYFTTMYGNASSVSHVYGWDAEEAVNLAREKVARLISAHPSEIYFTSGATESVNIALKGVCEAIKAKGNHIITCKTEHHAVLDTCEALEKEGFEITYLGVDQNGLIDLHELQDALSKNTILVSVMHSNNETGVIQPLEKIAAILKNHQALLMTDATQSLGKVHLDVSRLGINLACFSAHKLYGPKGVGALFVKSQSQSALRPVHFGGGQEKGLRPGTLNVPGIVGLGKACEICSDLMSKESQRLLLLRDQMEEKLLAMDGLVINGRDAPRLPHMTNVSIENIDGSRLIRSLKNLAISQGSACSSGNISPSHVLTNMGHSEELALSSLRIGLGRSTTLQDVQFAAKEIQHTIQKLRLSAT